MKRKANAENLGVVFSPREIDRIGQEGYDIASQSLLVDTNPQLPRYMVTQNLVMVSKVAFASTLHEAVRIEREMVRTRPDEQPPGIFDLDE